MLVFNGNIWMAVVFGCVIFGVAFFVVVHCLQWDLQRNPKERSRKGGVTATSVIGLDFLKQ